MNSVKSELASLECREVDAIIWQRTCTFKRDQLQRRHQKLPQGLGCNHGDLLSLIFRCVTNFKVPAKPCRRQIS